MHGSLPQYQMDCSVQHCIIGTSIVSPVSAHWKRGRKRKEKKLHCVANMSACIQAKHHLNRISYACVKITCSISKRSVNYMAAVTCKTQRRGRTYSLDHSFQTVPFELFLEEGKTSRKIHCGLPSLFYCYANSWSGCCGCRCCWSRILFVLAAAVR